jgi:broad specificity phosphatase PhoE
VRLYLVRHGRPAAAFGEAADAGLDPTGVAQAEAIAGRLAPLGPLALLTSPMRRTRETAAPLEQRWGRPARVEPAVSEIPSPSLSVAERGPWLQAVMAGRWTALDPALGQWRGRVLAALLALPESAVVFTHFVAINVAAGAALGDDRVVLFRPDHGSVTVVDVEHGHLRLVERGAEAATAVT